MDTCGSQTLVQPRRNSKRIYVNRSKHNVFLVWIENNLLSFVLVFLLVGCAPTIKYGSPPKVNYLETFKVSTSTKADVLLALGEPRGYGAARLSASPTLQEIWFYEYTKAEGSRIDLKILLVFFDKGFYNGHLWFSSAQLLDIKE